MITIYSFQTLFGDDIDFITRSYFEAVKFAQENHLQIIMSTYLWVKSEPMGDFT